MGVVGPTVSAMTCSLSCLQPSPFDVQLAGYAADLTRSGRGRSPTCVSGRVYCPFVDAGSSLGGRRARYREYSRGASTARCRHRRRFRRAHRRARSLGSAPVDVTLIDRNNFHTFSPLLYQVATAGVAPDDIAPSVRGVVRREPNAEFHMEHVVGIDFDDRRVIVADGDPIAYDYLILAAGAVSSDFGVPGVAEHALAAQDRSRTRSRCAPPCSGSSKKRIATTRSSHDGALRIVVAGGGPTGVELCGAMAELFTKVLAKDFETLDIRSAEVILLEAAGRLLGALLGSVAGRSGARARSATACRCGSTPQSRPSTPTASSWPTGRASTAKW